MNKLLLASVLSLGLLFTGCDNSNNNSSSTAGSSYSSSSQSTVTPVVRTANPSKVSAPLALSGNKVDEALKHNYVLILDDSGSMSERDSSGEVKFTGALRAVNTFISKLSDNDTLYLVTLNNNVASGKKNAIKMLSTLTEGGGTPLGNALIHSLSYLDKKVTDNSGYGYYTIISITDGESNDPTNEIIHKIFHYNKADISLKTIGFDMPSNNPLNSAYTEYFSASDSVALEKILTSIKAEVETFNDTTTTFE